METIIQYLPYLVPIICLQVLLAIIAIIHVLKHPYYRFGNKATWIVIVLLIQLIGPIFYFVFGRSEE